MSNVSSEVIRKESSTTMVVKNRWEFSEGMIFGCLLLLGLGSLIFVLIAT